MGLMDAVYECASITKEFGEALQAALKLPPGSEVSVGNNGEITIIARGKARTVGEALKYGFGGD